MLGADQLAQIRQGHGTLYRLLPHWIAMQHMRICYSLFLLGAAVALAFGAVSAKQSAVNSSISDNSISSDSGTNSTASSLIRSQSSSASKLAASSAKTTCTRPLKAVAGQPYCSVPSTISTQAQAYLRSRGPNPGPNPLTVASAEQQRRDFNVRVAPVSADAARRYLQTIVNGTYDGVPVTVGTPKGLNSKNRDKMILFLHGGAYAYGSCYHYWQVSALVAYSASIPVTCVEYRLAPPHTFPAGLNDALAVYKYLLQRHNPRNIIIMGDSAGGGMTLALTLKLKQDDLPLPAAIVLISPWSDLDKTGDTLTTLSGVDPGLQYEFNLRNPALAYVGGDSSKLRDPLVSPLRANFSAPWPHTYIQVGLRDSFLSSCVMLYRKLRPLRASSGVDVEISPWEGMWHVFSGVLDVPEAVAANKEVAEFVLQHVGR